MIRVAINGFGRIGKTFLRCVLQDSRALRSLEIVSINIGPARKDAVAHMFKYDSLMGTYPDEVRFDGERLIIGSHSIEILNELDPLSLSWDKRGIDWVVEASGCFTKRDGAQKHLTAGSKKVLISAPAKDEDITIIPGVNDAAYDSSKHHIVSLGSCTTNAFLTMIKVLHDTFGIERSFMTTVHAYTNTQVLLDVENSDLRRSRAAALNIIPTTTGAMKVMGKIIPELIGCVEAVALRVPVAKVSLIDLTFQAKKTFKIEEINQAFTHAAQSSMQGILGITLEPLVSSDFNGEGRSVVIDGLLSTTCGEKMGKVFGWYDNEWGYSERLKDFLMSTA